MLGPQRCWELKADTGNHSGNSPSSHSSPGEWFLDTWQQGTDTGDARGGGLHTSDSWNRSLLRAVIIDSSSLDAWNRSLEGHGSLRSGLFEELVTALD